MTPARRILPPFLFAAALAAQQPSIALLPVGDLVGDRFKPEAYLGLPNMPGARLIEGEESWLATSGNELVLRRLSGYYTGDALVQLLADLAGGDAGSVKLLRNGTLLGVPRERAEALRGALDGVRQRLPAQVRVELQLTATSNGATVTLLDRTVEGSSGAVEIASALTETTAVVDYEVEIAQSASMANPVVQRVRTGAMVVLRPLVAPAGDAALLEVLARVVEPQAAPPIATGHAGFGPIDRLALRVAEHAAVLRTSLGGKAEQRWSGPDGTDYALLLHVWWTVPAPSRPGGHELEYLAPCGAFAGFRTLPEWPQDVERVQPPGLLVTLAEGEQLREVTEAPTARVALDATASNVRAAAGALFEVAAQGAPVEITCYDVPAGAKAAADGAPPDGSRRIGGALVTGIDDTWACVTAYSEQTYVRDWDVEVAQSARIPDPKCWRTQDGLFVNLRRRGDRLEFEGELALRSPTTVQTLALDTELSSPESNNVLRSSDGKVVGQTSSPAVLLPQDQVQIEQPVVRRLPIGGRLPLRAGNAASARQAAALFGAGRELLIVARLLQ